MLLLIEHSWTVRELAARLNANKSQIQRDLDVMVGIFPIQFEYGEGSGKPFIYWIDRADISTILLGRAP